MTIAAVVALLVALPTVALYFRNARLFRPPPVSSDQSMVSVLIPARNEEAGIAACVESVLASRDVELECVVLDDQSEDRTAAIVRDLSSKDARVRLESAPPLPPGWAGKQHACHTLAGHARHPVLVFLDADVRLAPDAVARMAAFLIESRADLVSGFPRQVTGTLFERLLIPLMHFVLLGFLPFHLMRKSVSPGFAAGCGQFFVTTKAAYDSTGGHAHPLVRTSFHDGVKLPRAYRQAGRMTDLCDVTDLASCRMYRSAGQVWRGLAKNAGEGLGAPRLIGFFTAVLLAGQVLPFVLFPLAVAAESWPSAVIAAAACLLAWAVRFHAAWRFQQSWLGALLHPVAVLLLLAVQWYAAGRALVGRPVGWKGRPLPTGANA